MKRSWKWKVCISSWIFNRSMFYPVSNRIYSKNLWNPSRFKIQALKQIVKTFKCHNLKWKKGNSLRTVEGWENIWLQKMINKVSIFNLFSFFTPIFTLLPTKVFTPVHTLVPTQVYSSKHTPVPTVVPAPELTPTRYLLHNLL